VEAGVRFAQTYIPASDFHSSSGRLPDSAPLFAQFDQISRNMVTGTTQFSASGALRRGPKETGFAARKRVKGIEPLDQTDANFLMPARLQQAF
jgi:hypothetical protein